MPVAGRMVAGRSQDAWSMGDMARTGSRVGRVARIAGRERRPDADSINWPLSAATPRTSSAAQSNTGMTHRTRSPMRRASTRCLAVLDSGARRATSCWSRARVAMQMERVSEWRHPAVPNIQGETLARVQRTRACT